MADKIFAQGIRTFKPNDNAPDFVLGTLVITPNDLFAWMKGEGKEHLTTYKESKQIRFQVTKAREGGIVIAVDTFKPTEKKQESTGKQEPRQTQPTNSSEEDLPF